MQENNPGMKRRERQKEEVPGADSHSGGDAGAPYAALLPGQVWQVDGMEEIAKDPLLLATSGAESEEGENVHHAVASLDEPILLRRIVEALLFLGGEPLTPERAGASVRGLTPAEFMRTIDDLNRDYRVQGRPYHIRPWKNGYELALRPRYLPLAEKLVGATREARLSPTAIDVLALVAYRQPIAKQEVDSLRGAGSGGLLRQLVRRGLLSVAHEQCVGKSETVYRTTQRFLDFFQLRGPEDLPQTHDLQKL
jgi:segregation and condensation protein B